MKMKWVIPALHHITLINKESKMKDNKKPTWVCEDCEDTTTILLKENK